MSCAHVCTLHSSAPNSPGACIIVPLMPLQGGLSKASSIINMPFTSISSINESWADHYLKIDLQIPPLTSLSMSETSIDIQQASCVITDWTNTSTIQQPFTLNHHPLWQPDGSGQQLALWIVTRITVLPNRPGTNELLMWFLCNPSRFWIQLELISNKVYTPAHSWKNHEESTQLQILAANRFSWSKWTTSTDENKRKRGRQ